MDRIIRPAGVLAVKQADAFIRIAFAVSQVATQKVVAAGKLVSVMSRVVKRLFYRGFQRRSDDFIGINTQHPVMGCLIDGKLLLSAKAQPCLRQYPCAEGRRYRLRSIYAA